MTAPLDRKLGIKKEMRAIVIDAPGELRSALGEHLDDLKQKLHGFFDYIHLFVESAAELDANFPKLKKHLRAGGMLWVSWMKGKRPETELTLGSIIEIGYRHGLVESKTISVDAVWSAIKFTFPKEGKQYRNSYGELKRDAS